MPNVMDVLPQLEGQEMQYVQSLIGGMSDENARRFAAAYSIRRKDSMTLLLLACVGFIGVAGIHRFLIGQIGMGVLYLLTGGVCWIGTIIDLVNIKAMALEYNTKIAQEIASMM